MTGRSRLCIVLLVVCSLIPSMGGAQQERPLAIDVDAAGRASIHAAGVLDDPGLRAALDSGLPLRIHLRIELWRKQLFDRLAYEREFELVLIRDPLDRSLRLEDGPLVSVHADFGSVAAAVDAALQPRARPTAPGRYYYLAVLEVQTLSLSDVEELRRWLRGDVQRAVEGRASPGRAIERGLGRLFVRVIGVPSRKYEARSRTFIVPDNP